MSPSLRWLYRPDSPGKGFRLSSVVETFLFLLGVYAVNRAMHPGSHGYLGVHPHPYWIIVILIAIRYPFREGMICSALVSLAYTLFVVFPDEGVYYFLTINLFSDFRDPLLFLVVGGIISGYTEHLVRRTEVYRGRLVERDTEMEVLEERNNAATEALQKLELRIAGQFTSMVDLFGSLSKTKVMGPDEIKANLLDVMRQYLNVEQCAYFDYERENLVAACQLGQGEDAAEAEVQTEGDFILMEALRTRRVAYLGHFTQQSDLERYRGSSLLAGPLLNASGKVMGVVSVGAMPFLDYNPHSFKLLETILGWWANVLEEGARLRELRERSVFDEELGLYNFTYAWNRMAEEFRRAVRFSIPLSLALLRIDDYEDVPAGKRMDLRVALARIITQQVTELEMVSCYKSDDTIAVTFPFLMGADAEEKLRQIDAGVSAYGLQPYGDSDRTLALSWVAAGYEIGMKSFEELVERAEAGLGPPPGATPEPGSGPA